MRKSSTAENVYRKLITRTLKEIKEKKMKRCTNKTTQNTKEKK